MQDPEIESRDDWARLVRECQSSLMQSGIRTDVTETGLLDKALARSWRLFSEYTFLIPVYNLTFPTLRTAELSIVGVCLHYITDRSNRGDRWRRLPDQLVKDCEPRFFAVAKIGVQPGNLTIEPRDLKTDINELFHHTHVAIDGYEDFRVRHSCYFETPERAADVLTGDFLTSVDDLGDVELEIQDDTLIAGFKRDIETDDLVRLATFLHAISTSTVTK